MDLLLVACILSVFCKSVPLVQNSKNSKKIGHHVNAPYLHNLSVPGIQFRAVPVSFTHNNKPTVTNKR